MVKCLNIGKNIGKPIYRSISTGNDRRDLQTHLFLLPPVSVSPATALISLRDRLSVPAPALYSCKRATTSHLEPDKSIRPLPAFCYSCSAAISYNSINLLLLTTFSPSGLSLLCDRLQITSGTAR